ncbi:hypothetical protein WICPIJ_001014 [Wickerhamomyces pijperi]|uniref:Copper-fist domain-containing protein n=1 Tax=Wickerhamomyces pijperi TaxID=599730 RepID=A0A9P8QEH1_WICPI|nr:hypothetical protein WICPIJ_001014 [Wickerhamomyces pijperi]
MIYSDHLRLGCQACIKGHKAYQCRHFKNIALGAPVYVINDQGVGKVQTTETNNCCRKESPKDDQIKVRLVKATLSDKNPYCPLSKKYQFQCRPNCENPSCNKSSIQNVFINTEGMKLVKCKNGLDIVELEETKHSPTDLGIMTKIYSSDVVENYFPSSCDFMARTGISYHHIVDPCQSGNTVALLSKECGMAKLRDAGDLRDHNVASPYFSSDVSKRPSNCQTQYVDLELCAEIVAEGKVLDSTPSKDKKETKKKSLNIRKRENDDDYKYHGYSKRQRTRSSSQQAESIAVATESRSVRVEPLFEASPSLSSESSSPSSPLQTSQTSFTDIEDIYCQQNVYIKVKASPEVLPAAPIMSYKVPFKGLRFQPYNTESEERSPIASSTSSDTPDSLIDPELFSF